MLWWRRHAEKEALGKAEGRQKEDAPIRQGGHPARGVHFRTQDGQLSRLSATRCNSYWRYAAPRASVFPAAKQ